MALAQKGCAPEAIRKKSFLHFVSRQWPLNKSGSFIISKERAGVGTIRRTPAFSYFAAHFGDHKK
jgi:hypothetical protein